MKNLAEAEYSVALYMYMRLLGYPADRISILTTYNGQKHLIRDVINQRCAGNPFFAQPNKVRTYMCYLTSMYPPKYLKNCMAAVCRDSGVSLQVEMC